MSRIIKNASVFRSGAWRKSDILVEGEKIALVADSIESNLKVDSPEEAGDGFDPWPGTGSARGPEVFDVDGAWVIPGYIDQHVHITGGGGEGSFISQVPPLGLGEPVLAGVTTLVGLLGTDGTTRSVGNLVAKTKSFREFGITAYCLTGNYRYPSPTLTGSVMDDIVYIDEIIGVKIAIADHRSSNMSKEDLIKLASDARVAGMLSGKPGIVHLHTGSGKGKLNILFEILEETDIPVSVFRPTHLAGKYEDALRFARLGGYIDFTCDPEDMKGRAELIIRAISEAPEGSVTVSTDSNGSLPVWNEKKEMIGIGAGKITSLHETVKAMVQDWGFPLEEAVKPMTENVAKALNLYPRKGRIGIGADADMIVLCEDLSINAVLAKGRIMVEKGKLRVPVPFE